MPPGNCKLCLVIAGYFVPIDADECLRLLAQSTIGRVAWASSQGMQVLPVNYTLLGDAIAFTVAPDTILEELARPTRVAFEVDDLDASTATGWSVLVQGETAPFTGDRDALTRLPWVPGHQEIAIAIKIDVATGRSVSADSDGEPCHAF